MHKLMKIVGYILAIIGFAYIVKHIMHCKECRRLRGWHKIKVEDEKRQGSRYGSNPIRY